MPLLPSGPQTSAEMMHKGKQAYESPFQQPLLPHATRASNAALFLDQRAYRHKHNHHRCKLPQQQYPFHGTHLRHHYPDLHLSSLILHPHCSSQSQSQNLAPQQALALALTLTPPPSSPSIGPRNALQGAPMQFVYVPGPGGGLYPPTYAGAQKEAIEEEKKKQAARLL